MEAPADTEITSPVFYQGRITQIIDPQNFWMQIGTDEALAYFYQLEADIEDFCKANESWLMSVEELTEGQLVLVDSGQKEKIWRRGQVARIDRHENVADILYVDYGNTGIVPAGKICPQVPGHIMDQTQFAMRCSLAGVQPIGRTWTSRGIRKFQELMEDQVFQTLVLYSRLGSVVVALYFDETRNGRSVAHFLLDEEVAMPSEEIEIPEFSKDVPSFLVAYAADYSSHSAGSFYSDETTTETQHDDPGISNDDMEKKISSSSNIEEITASPASQNSNSVSIPNTKRGAPSPGFTVTVNQPIQTLELGVLQQEENEIGTDDQNNGTNDQFLNDISINSNVSFLPQVVEKSVDKDFDSSNIVTLPVLHPQVLGQWNTRASSSGIEDHDKCGQIMTPESPVVISGFNLQQIDHTHELSTHGLHHKTLQQKRQELEEEALDIISEIDEHASIAALAGYGSLVDESKLSEYRDPLDPDVFQEISASIRDAVTRGNSRIMENVQDSPAHSPSRLRDQGSRRSPRQQRRKTKDSSTEEVNTQRGENKESERSEKSDQNKESVDSPSVADIDFSKVVQEVLESGKTEGMENTKVLLLEIFEMLQETKPDKHLEDVVESLLVRVITEPDVYFTVVMEVLDKVQGDLDLKNFLVNSVRKLQDQYIKVHVTRTSLHRSCARMIGGVFNLSVAWEDSNSTIQSAILTTVEKWIVFNMKGTQCGQDDRQAIFLDCFDDFWLVSGSILSFHNPEMVSRLQGEIKEKVLNEGVSRCIRERLLDMLFQNFSSLTRNPERCCLGIQTEGEITPDGGNKGRKSTASQTNHPTCTEKGTMTEEDWPSLPPIKTPEKRCILRQRTDKSLGKTTKGNLSGSRAAVSTTESKSELSAFTGDQTMVDTIGSKTGQVNTFESQVFIRPIVKTKPPFYHHSPSPKTNSVHSSVSVEGSFFVTPNKSHGSLLPSCNIDEGNASKESQRSIENGQTPLPNSASRQSRQPVSSEIDKDLSKQPSTNEHTHDSSQISCEKKSGSEEIDWFDYDPSKHKNMQKHSAPKLDEMSKGDIAAFWISSYSRSDSLLVEKREKQSVSSGASNPSEKSDSVMSEKVSLSSMDSDRKKEMLEHSTSAVRNDSLSDSGNCSDKPCKSDGAFTERYSKMVRDEGKKKIIDWWNLDEDFGDRNHTNTTIISNEQLQNHNKLKIAYPCENKLEDVDNAEEIVEPVSDTVSDQVSCAVADVQKVVSDEEEIEKLKKMYAGDEEYNLKWQARNGKTFTKVDEFAFEEEEEDDEGDWEDLDDSAAQADVESDYSSGSKPTSKGNIIEGVYHRASMPKWVPGTRKCTTCGETSHLVYNCPNDNKSHLI